MGRHKEAAARIEDDTSFPRDRLIQKANRIQKENGYPFIFTAGQSEDQIRAIIVRTKLNGELKVKPAFTGRDKILIHFNRVLPAELKTRTNELLRSKYVDHIATHKFGSTYAARCFIDTIIELCSDNVPEPSAKWVAPNRYYINNWILISTDDQSEESLEDIMEHKYTPEEKKWRLPHPYDTYARSIAFYHHGTHTQINTHTRRSHGKPPLTDEELRSLGMSLPKPREENKKTRLERIAEVGEKRKREERKERKSKPDNLISLADICKPMKIDPREARQALRKAKTPKPDVGWSWPKAEAPAVTKLVEKAVKKLRDKK